MDNIINLSNEDKIIYLQNIKTNLLLRCYIRSLISNYYITIPNIKRGYATEMIRDNSLDGYSFETVNSMINFFNNAFNSFILSIYNFDSICYIYRISFGINASYSFV